MLELIVGVIAVLFVVIFTVLAILEIELAWAAGIAVSIVVALCAMLAVRFPSLLPSPADAVQTISLPQIGSLLAVMVVVAFVVRRLVARRTKKLR